MNLPIEICELVHDYIPYKCHLSKDQKQTLRQSRAILSEGKIILGNLQLLSGLGIVVLSEISVLVSWIRTRSRIMKTRTEVWKTTISCRTKKIQVQDCLFENRKNYNNPDAWLQEVVVLMSHICWDIYELEKTGLI